jgi:predicted DNA-binding transcriptional regulator AlpA
MATTNNSAQDKLLNDHEVARLTGLSVATLRRWRLLGKGPRYAKLGALVRYRLEDLQAFIERNARGGSDGNQ